MISQRKISLCIWSSKSHDDLALLIWICSRQTRHALWTFDDIGTSSLSRHKWIVWRRTTGLNRRNRWRNRVQSFKWGSDNDGIVACMRFGTIHNTPASLSSNHLSKGLSKHRRKLNRTSLPMVIPTNGIYRCLLISFSIDRFHHLLSTSSKPFETRGNFFGQWPTIYIDEKSFKRKEWIILFDDAGPIKSLVEDERQYHSANSQKRSNSKRRSSSQRTGCESESESECVGD